MSVLLVELGEPRSHAALLASVNPLTPEGLGSVYLIRSNHTVKARSLRYRDELAKTDGGRHARSRRTN
jgi:hypothetical protein